MKKNGSEKARGREEQKPQKIELPVKNTAVKVQQTVRAKGEQRDKKKTDAQNMQIFCVRPFSFCLEIQ